MARASFVQLSAEDGDEVSMFNNKPDDKDINSFYGSIHGNGSHSQDDILIGTVGTVKVGNGNANIDPSSKDVLLTSLTFTPQGTNELDGFFANVQLDYTGTLENKDAPTSGTFFISVNGDAPFSYTQAFDTNDHTNGFDELDEKNGTLITSVHMWTDTDIAFKEVKQIDWSLCGVGECGSVIQRGVPEPSTWAMMILGFLGVGFMAYRRKQNGPKLRIA